MCEYLVAIMNFIFTLDKDQCGSKYISRISILLLCSVCFIRKMLLCAFLALYQHSCFTSQSLETMWHTSVTLSAVIIYILSVHRSLILVVNLVLEQFTYGVYLRGSSKIYFKFFLTFIDTVLIVVAIILIAVDIPLIIMDIVFNSCRQCFHHL